MTDEDRNEMEDSSGPEYHVTMMAPVRDTVDGWRHRQRTRLTFHKERKTGFPVWSWWSGWTEL